jgi:hypothetical protein
MIVKSVLSYLLWLQPILDLYNEVVVMQANKHISYSSRTYNSSYNTQIVATQPRVEIAEGRQMQESSSVEHVNSGRSGASLVGDASFDFAGLAG